MTDVLLSAALSAAEALGLDPRSTNLERVRDGYAFAWEGLSVTVTDPGADVRRMRERGEARRAHNERLHSGAA